MPPPDPAIVPVPLARPAGLGPSPAAAPATPVTPPKPAAPTERRRLNWSHAAGRPGGPPAAVKPHLPAAPTAPAVALPDTGGEDASTALLKPSRAPAVMRAFALALKWGLPAALLLGGTLYFLRDTILPVIEELRHPSKPDTAHTVSTPTAVRALQQTRQVIAQNDARVADLDRVLVGDAPKPPPAAPVAAAASVPLSGPVLDASACQRAVDRLQVGGIYEGTPLRAHINGRIVKQGEVVDHSLGLRFDGIDPLARMLIFRNPANEAFKRRY